MTLQLGHTLVTQDFSDIENMSGWCTMVNYDVLPNVEDIKQEIPDNENGLQTQMFEEMHNKEESAVSSNKSSVGNTANNATSCKDVPKETLYHCAQCDYKTTKKPSLKSHVKFHSTQKPYVCSVCNYKTIDKSNLKSHLKVHTGEKSHECPHCGYKTTSKFYLKQHVTMHTGERLFKCDICNYSARYRPSLVRHMELHNGEKRVKKTQPCAVCGFRARDNQSLNSHMKRHSNEKPFSCTECQYKAKKKSLLRLHIKKLHQREVLGIDPQGNVHIKNATGFVYKFHHKNLPADFSSYTNSEKCILRQGSRFLLQGNEKPFSCTECHYKAKMKSHLRLHTRRLHQREVLGIDPQGIVHVKNAIGFVYKFHHKSLPADFSTYTNSEKCILRQGSRCLLQEGHGCVKCFVYLDMQQACSY